MCLHVCEGKRERQMEEQKIEEGLTFLQVSSNSSRSFQEEFFSKCLQLLVEVFDLLLGDLSQKEEKPKG